MKISKDRYQELCDKREFVSGLNLAFQYDETKRYTSIAEIYYDFFATESGSIKEYAVVRYFGGAIAVRNCAANSLSAIFRAIGTMLDGGYYDEVDTYKKLKEIEVPIRVEE